MSTRSRSSSRSSQSSSSSRSSRSTSKSSYSSSSSSRSSQFSDESQQPTAIQEVSEQDIQNESATAFEGEYAVKSVICQKYIKTKSGKEELFLEVDWERSGIRARNFKSKSLKNIPFGEFTPGLKIIDEPGDVASREPGYRCRFCERGFYDRSNGTRHEKVCNVPGAPGHNHNQYCKPDCPGKSVWTRPPDGRIGNSKAGRPRAK